MKKLLLTIMLVFALALCFTACGSSGEAEETTDTETTGGWELDADMPVAQLDDKIQQYFEDAMENYNQNVGDGIEYTPVSLLATQEGDGSAYWILCKTDDEVPLKIVSFSVDGKENVGFGTVADFDLGEYTEDNDPVDHTDADWYVRGEPKTALPKDVQKAFDTALAEFDGSQVEPVLYLGSQVVSGTKYSILCTTTTITTEPLTNIAVVTIYADLDGNYEIAGISNIDISQF